MYYLRLIREGRWIRRWSEDKGTTYGFKISSTGKNGANVPDMQLEEATIRNFFLQYGVEYNAKHGLWWTYEKFEETSESNPFNNHITFSAGYKFEISEDAYKMMFE